MSEERWGIKGARGSGDEVAYIDNVTVNTTAHQVPYNTATLLQQCSCTVT